MVHCRNADDVEMIVIISAAITQFTFFLNSSDIKVVVVTYDSILG